ncbi:helix-turn-helix transcriptional regulator [Xanthobacter sp. V4C-4]|uniref:S24 family peptidase n=1 Tax=Xanthobacter cornucopiae TaxID=3119924 RepID=UPI00372AB0B3
MLTHGQIWRAVDQLAEQHGLSTSGLAKRAGLDPTTFNRSKRITTDGRPRWPSTESIAKALDATGTSVEDFFALLEPERAHAHGAGFEEESSPLTGRPHTIPQIGFAQAGRGGVFDGAGCPTGAGWDEIVFPDLDDPKAYALEVAGEALLPVYRDGDMVVVSPSSPVRRGDRVVVRTTAGEVLVKELARKTARRIELRALDPAQADRAIPLEQVEWMARIVWASQ